jgi:hypothetical protein
LRVDQKAVSESTIPSTSSFERNLFGVAAAFNLLVASVIVIPGSFAWALLRMAPPDQPLFLHLFAAFVLLFGLVYLWIALDVAGKQALILLGAIGKLAVMAVVLGHYLAGSIPVEVVMLGSGDLVFAVLFLTVFHRRRAEAPSIL